MSKEARYIVSLPIRRQAYAYLRATCMQIHFSGPNQVATGSGACCINLYWRHTQTCPLPARLFLMMLTHMRRI